MEFTEAMPSYCFKFKVPGYFILQYKLMAIKFQVPIIRDMLKRRFYRSTALAIGSGIVLAEIYYRTYVIPHRQRREEYFKKLGVTYVHPFDN